MAVTCGAMEVPRDAVPAQKDAHQPIAVGLHPGASPPAGGPGISSPWRPPLPQPGCVANPGQNPGQMMAHMSHIHQNAGGATQEYVQMYKSYGYDDSQAQAYAAAASTKNDSILSPTCRQRLEECSSVLSEANGKKLEQYTYFYIQQGYGEDQAIDYAIWVLLNASDVSQGAPQN